MNLTTSLRALGCEAACDLDALRLVESGLPRSALEALGRLGDVPAADLRAVFPHGGDEAAPHHLGSTVSDAIVEAAGVYLEAHEVFASRRKANAWMRTPNRTLGGRAPLALLRTSIGARLVADALTRIAYGVYA